MARPAGATHSMSRAEKSPKQRPESLQRNAEGLYHPSHEHDSCGVGLVVDVEGRKSNKIVRNGIQVLENLAHRGACGCEENTGDGAGIMLQIPDEFMRNVTSALGFELPGAEEYGVGMLFLPREADAADRCQQLFEQAIVMLGLSVLATKVYGRMGDGPNDAKLSARHIKLACEDSLRRLQTDFIDIYQMHHIDRDTPWDEVWQAMEQLVREGKVLYVGSSNFAGFHIAQACERARQRNFLGLVSEQSLYNLNARTIELEVIPACERYGLGLLPWSPLGGGLLGGVLKKAEEGRRASEFVQTRIERFRPRLEAYEKFCAEIDQPPGEVALAWLLHQSAVTAPIIGPRDMAQLDSAIRATEMELGTETLTRLDEIFPGPGGAAPEAYAW